MRREERRGGGQERSEEREVRREEERREGEKRKLGREGKSNKNTIRCHRTCFIEQAVTHFTGQRDTVGFGAKYTRLWECVLCMCYVSMCYGCVMIVRTCVRLRVCVFVYMCVRTYVCYEAGRHSRG